jgi:hypothetical protein
MRHRTADVSLSRYVRSSRDWIKVTANVRKAATRNGERRTKYKGGWLNHALPSRSRPLITHDKIPSRAIPNNSDLMVNRANGNRIVETQSESSGNCL